MEKVKDILKSLIEKLGVNEAVIDVVDNKGVLEISIQSNDEHSLIGRDNEKYDALSHLLKRMIAKEFGEDKKAFLDVNNMRAKKEEALKIKASIIADRARAFKIDVEMDPMSSYERMIVHAHLAEAPLVKTESIGEGRTRRLVVKYAEDKS